MIKFWIRQFIKDICDYNNVRKKINYFVFHFIIYFLIYFLLENLQLFWAIQNAFKIFIVKKVFAFQLLKHILDTIKNIEVNNHGHSFTIKIKTTIQHILESSKCFYYDLINTNFQHFI